MRTTVNIDAPILKDLKRLQRKEGKPLGKVISDLLGRALAERRSAKRPAKPSGWISKPMGARVDLSDRDALFAAMEEKAHLPQ